ncbi:hypothetical protein DRH13_02675 [Candidatus Woesebacteria bacterium]|nr:MAG: hypothetical protein DRH13_02675 [Candidatus Woesebacteria bacterium]
MLNFLYSTAVLAADDINLNPTGEFAALGDLTVGGIVSAFIRLILVIAALVFFFILVIGGIRWIASGGDKAAIEGARGKITNAIVGVVILLSLFALLKVVEDFFGINILALDIGPLMIQ